MIVKLYSIQIGDLIVHISGMESERDSILISWSKSGIPASLPVECFPRYHNIDSEEEKKEE